MDSILCYNRKPSDDYYNILGCEESSTEEQIIAEFKVKALALHPDKNQDDPATVKKFQKLQKAKEILTDPEKRKLYDTWRRSGLSIPFEQWQNLSKECHTSMHWASKKQKDLMLEDASEIDISHSIDERIIDKTAVQAENTKYVPYTSEEFCWRREPASEVLQKFRNYEI